MKENAFERSGLKKTPKRILIYQLLEKYDYPVTAEEIHLDSYRLCPKPIDLSTVYRTLNTFAEVKLVRREVNDEKKNIYSILPENDHHILVCVECNKRVHIDGCPYHEVNEEIEKKTGFHIEDHNIEIYGLCPDCQHKKHE